MHSETVLRSFAIRALNQAAHDGIGEAHVFGEIHRGRPQAQQFSAIFVDDFLDFFRAFGFRKRVAFAIQRPAVGGRRAIGGRAAQANRDQQRTVEPAAVLIAAFQIHIGGPGKMGFSESAPP